MRVNASGIVWISQPENHTDPALSGKLGGKLADPSGNVIEIKYYKDVSEILANG
jgi:extradiol dioxygenase family protein